MLRGLERAAPQPARIAPFMMNVFEDRRHAGRALAHAVREQLDTAGAIVLGLPRGGVPVAFEVAWALHLPLDVFVVRKLGVPGQQELAMGAVASGGLVVVQEDVVRAFGISAATIDTAAATALEEIARHEALYREGRQQARVEGRSVILIDDGLATGSTMRAAVRALRPVAGRVSVAVPVAAAASCDELRREVDALACLEMPDPFHAVGEFYRNFDQTPDEEVRALLAAAYHEAEMQDKSPSGQRL
ncbi:MAG TPA: phosphoribosyltransferase family protein [Acidobacteriaceae bacterium]|nr:phosphoribosyltransferase family protein [Acidobacteriaceae bacterium]